MIIKDSDQSGLSLGGSESLMITDGICLLGWLLVPIQILDLHTEFDWVLNLEFV